MVYLVLLVLLGERGSFFPRLFSERGSSKGTFSKDSGSVRYVGYSENSVISLLLGNEIRALPLLEKGIGTLKILLKNGTSEHLGLGEYRQQRTSCSNFFPCSSNC